MLFSRVCGGLSSWGGGRLGGRAWVSSRGLADRTVEMRDWQLTLSHRPTHSRSGLAERAVELLQGHRSKQMMSCALRFAWRRGV